MKTKFLYILIFCIVIFTSNQAFALPDTTPPVEIHFIDVGQGDALLIYQPDRCAILIDSGPMEGSSKLLQFIQKLGISHLDAVLITHPHPDHYGGLAHIAKHLTIGKLYDNGETKSDPSFAQYTAIVKKNLYQSITTPKGIEYGDIKVKVIYPLTDSSIENLSTNDRSLIVEINIFKTQIMLLADASFYVENLLLKNSQLSHSNIIKVAHHGANDATSNQLLDVLKPELAIISVGADNMYQSPSPAVLTRLKSHGISILRTDLAGSITVTITLAGYTVKF